MIKIDFSAFERISLKDMSNIRLMRRTDKKFIFPRDYLLQMFSSLSQDYFIQEIKNKNIFEYNTIYFDTPDYKMYRAHQNGKLNRIKVRTREYVDSKLCFLEVKKKSNKGVTQKTRINYHQTDLINEDGLPFLYSLIPYDPMLLEAKLCSKYNRITLINKEKTERVTIDLNLCFINNKTQRKIFLPEVVIIEIKKEHSSFSPIMNNLNSLRIKPKGFSKYCIGVSLTENSALIKTNNFKYKLKYLHKITSFDYE
ncbi:polyphosphate polymerase domain-containing protein [Massilibacteroides sp.]|uniref:polyphosphate polymerase domain-containing protein n=1 Tax=Massilibacteroides sp. TaxID=2034766 RepID=UPI0026172FF9|nr:polyphosphate polymerase domain-containing protein [Massilibacteroides sp.]MDD4514851.1 polyphosphate polymerase domain-containing protein [Massilibacteroides sp.]